MGRMMAAFLVLAGGLQAQEKAVVKGEGATVTGEVKIEGPVGRIKNIPLTPECAQLHGGAPMKCEDVQVDDQSRVKWVFVWVKKGLEGKTFPLPEGDVLLDQRGCRYEPRVFGLRVGQTLKVRNSDPNAHNVHGLPFENREFNFMQPVQGQVDTVRFVKPESSVIVKLKCELHTWMFGWAGLLEHPFFAVTDGSGKFAIKDLPPGKYTLGVWHEAWTTVDPAGCEREIEVKAGEAKVVNFALDKKRAP